MNRNRQSRQNHKRRKADKAAKQPNAQRRKVFRTIEPPRRYGPTMPDHSEKLALLLGMAGGEVMRPRALVSGESENGH